MIYKSLLILAFFIYSISYGQSRSIKDLGNKTSQQALKEYLGPNNLAYKLISKVTDNLGYSHESYEAQINKIPVKNALYKVHKKKGEIYLITGQDIATSVSGSKIISSKIGKSKALKFWKVEQLQTGREVTSNLSYISYKKGLRLAYIVSIYSVSPFKIGKVYIDTENGEILGEESDFFAANVTGTASTSYSGNQSIETDSVSSGVYRLFDDSRGSGVHTMNLENSFFVSSAVEFTDSDNNWNTFTPLANKYGTDAHWASQKYYDYLNVKFTRNSYDDLGGELKTFVRYGTNYNNAFWDGVAVNCGDGNGSTTTSYTSLDIISHEFTHGLIESTANLNFSNEPGAITESICDMYATATEYYAKSASANFLIGEDIVTGTGALRSLASPNTYSQPDTYQGLNWAIGAADNGGVHTNGGVGNFWFYLLCNGGSGTNDLANTYNVTPIGITDAMKIVHRTLTVYMTATTDYASFRILSIQASEDLFGVCSAKTETVMRAWYAVGIGNAPTNNPVIANFSANQTFSCTAPTTINFTDLSQNATISHKWYFGDGDSSSVTNPNHTYANPGNFDVTLIVTGIGSCGTQTDTLIQSNFITITNTGGPVPANCSPITTNGTLNMGIYTVNFNTINYTGNGGSDNYSDWSCQHSTQITEGIDYAINITTGSLYSENVNVWIDLNNDGIFDNVTEKVFESLNTVTNHSGTINIPQGAVLNNFLRMRISSDFSNLALTPCSQPTYGNHTDYGVQILPNTNPPVADFVADILVASPGQIINLTDLSQNLPTDWSWIFPGANTNTSNIQNPTVSYPTIGTYPISLVATNAFGNDSIAKVGYINIVNQVFMCTGVNAINSINGQLFDSGGPTGSYSNNEDCSLLINPGCATSITLSFQDFYSPNNGHRMRVYDGIDATGTLIGSYNYISSAPATSLVANSGSMYITWVTNNSFGYSGFEATWTSTIVNTPPTANFSISNTNSPIHTPVTFTDLSTNNVGFHSWDFGNANTSLLANPSHTYTFPGTYTVQLIADNCFTKDTTTQSITIQSAPTLLLSQDTITETIYCGNIINDSILIHNQSGGDLVYNWQGLSDAYDSTSVQYYATSGAVTNHTFSNLNSESDSIYLKVDLNGDFSASFESCDISIDGTYIATFNPSIDYTLTSETFAIGGAIVSSALSDGTVVVTLTNSGAVGTGGIKLHQVQLFANYGYDWISGHNIGITPPMDSAYLHYSIDVNSLFPGVYLDSFQLVNNDPNFQNLTIPIYVTIIGEPIISTNHFNIDFDTLQVGAIDKDTFLIGNTGCDTLFISGINSSNSDITVTPSNIAIPPYSEDTITVTFSPSLISNYTDSLIVTNNDSTLTIYVNGVGIGAPNISYYPTELIDTITGCNDSVTIPFWIYNNGQGTLNGDIIIGNSFDTGTNGFYENFESNMSNWIVDGVNYTKQITNTNSYAGSSSLEMVGGANGHLDGVHTELNNLTPSTISFSVRNTSNSQYGNIIAIGENPNFSPYLTNGNCLIYFEMSYNGTLNFGTSSIMPYLANTWYFIELRNIDWLTKTYDIFIDGVFITSRSFTDTSISSINRMFVYKWSSNSISNIDEIKIGNYLASTDWISGSTDTINTPISDSTLVQVTLSSAGLNSGTYNSNIIIESNDPLSPTDSIPISFTVIGAPEISSNSGCIDFGTALQNEIKNDSTWIINTGCDTLFISNIVGNTSDYTTNFTNGQVLPGDSIQLQVSMSDPTVGMNMDTLWISNNDSIYPLCLKADIIVAPILNINPSIVNLSLEACDDSITVPIKLYNIGGSDLNYEIESNVSSGSLKILAITAGSDYSDEYINFKNAVLNSSNSPLITEITSTVISDVTSIINNYDMVIIPEISYSSSIYSNYYNNLNPTLEAFVNSGGNLIYAGSNSYGGFMFSGGMLSGSYLANIGGNQFLSKDQPTSSILNNTSPTITSPFYTYSYNINNANYSSILSYQNNTVVGTLEYGQGHIGLIGFDFDNINTQTSLITGNMVDYLYDLRNNTNVNYISSIGTITSNDSLTLNITVSSQGLDGGSYKDYVYITSNDPINPVDSIEINYTISSTPCGEIGIIDQFCNGKINFVDSSYNNPLLWEWDFGDATTSNLQNPSHTYNAIGFYTVELRVCNLTSCDTVTENIIISNVDGANPANCIISGSNTVSSHDITNFTFGTINKSSTANAANSYQDFSCSQFTDIVENTPYNLSVFTGGSNNNHYTKVWVDLNNNGFFTDPGEEIVSSFSAPTNPLSVNVTIPIGAVLNTPLRMRVGLDRYIYPSPCTSPQYGEFEDYTVTILPAIPAPTASGTYNISNICDGTFNFTDQSTGIISSWLWNFGDGNTSILQNPTHTYDTPGTYAISLTVGNSNGTDIYTTNVTANFTIATFTTNNIGVIEHQFTSTTPSAISWIWDFGDASFANTENPTHLYADANCYNVTLTATMPNGCNIISDPITVCGSTSPPMAGGIHTIPNTCEGTVNFTDQSNGFVSSWLWDFGDGNTSSQQNPTHTYEISGTYLVTLTVENPNGTDIYTTNVSTNFTVATFTANKIGVNTSQFTSTTSGATSWLWNFGDGFSENTPAPIHMYADDNCYNVSLIATISNGCNLKSDTITLCGGTPVSINENAFSYNLYPNPSNGEFTIQSETRITEITIYNTLGKIIDLVREPNYANQIVVYKNNQLAKGIYFVNIKTDIGSKVTQIILQ